MKINLICPYCRKPYRCEIFNTEMTGSIIETRCPRCRETYKGNVSAFVDGQAELNKNLGCIERAVFMITLAQNLGYKVNEDKHGVQMRRYMKRNLRS